MEITWEEPPRAALISVGHKGHYSEFAEALRAHEGQWALVPREYGTAGSAQNTAQNMRRGVVKGFVKGEFEVVSHEKQVWARYIGPVKDEGPPKRKGVKDDVDEGDDGSADDDERKAYPGKVRAWAKINGREVSSHGRLPDNLIADYEADTGDMRPASPLTAVP